MSDSFVWASCKWLDERHGGRLGRRLLYERTFLYGRLVFGERLGERPWGRLFLYGRLFLW